MLGGLFNEMFNSEMNEIDYLNSILDKIIDDNLDSFKENNSFQVKLLLTLI
jgi:hypothetical protein